MVLFPTVMWEFMILFALAVYGMCCHSGMMLFVLLLSSCTGTKYGSAMFEPVACGGSGLD